MLSIITRSVLDHGNGRDRYSEYTSFNEKVENENTETLDTFEPAMHNLFDTLSIIIDAILDGEI